MDHLPYLRHSRGSGRLYDTSEACEQSFIDRESKISNHSGIWHSKIIASEVSASIVSDSLIKHSTVHATDIRGGSIEWSILNCELIHGNVRIENSVISGKSRIAGRAVCQNVHFRDLTVKGSAVLMDWPDTVFDGGHGYVSRGVWQRPPRVVRLPFDVTVTESVTDESGLYAYVACREFPVERWLRIGDRYGRQRGWTPSQVDAVRQVLLSWLETPDIKDLDGPTAVSYRPEDPLPAAGLP